MRIILISVEQGYDLNTIMEINSHGVEDIVVLLLTLYVNQMLT